jgi:hypothetical protein
MAKEEESEALVKAPAGGLSLQIEGEIITSLDMKQEGNRLLYLDAVNGERIKVADRIGETFAIADYMASPWEGVDDETGEVVKSVALTLFTDAGEVLACVSGGAWRSFKALAFAFGPPPWKPARPLVVRQRQIGDKKRTFYFDIVRTQKKGK